LVNKDQSRKTKTKTKRHTKYSKHKSKAKQLTDLTRNLAWLCILTVLTLSVVKNSSFEKSNMADSRHFESKKSPYLSSGFTNRHEIWRGDVQDPSEP